MNKRLPCTKPEIWGGMECTINRVGDVYRDQLAETGHYERRDDLHKLSALGFTKFRYPILWERHFPKKDHQEEWEWTAGQLNILRKKNIEPIAGLIHHGSGPLYTNLLDMEFPVKLAAYAKQVAETFPWIRFYTPVNEPLTTARFSGLYGFWYPHKKSDAAFVRMLLNQLKGIVLSMQAIREINPEASLIQTEDLSKTYSTPALAYQAEFENQRRWLTYDFLTGKVNKEHFAWKYFIDNGIEEDELFFFLDNLCPPAIAGFNYYVTSERFLDENISKYPRHTHGHNHEQAYADTEAARSGHMKGAAGLLKEAWWRYRIPIALTECQLVCTREQQMKWFYQHYKFAEDLRRQAIPVVAITAWGLLGAVDWNTLICQNNGQYESGVFEIQKQQLQPTATARMIRTLAKGKDCYHPALDGRGWWQPAGSTAFNYPLSLRGGSGKRLVIIDNNSPIGNIFHSLCQERDLLCTVLSAADAEYLDHEQLAKKIDKCFPWAIVDVRAPIMGPDSSLFEKPRRTHRSFIVQQSRPIQLLQFSAGFTTDGSKGGTDHPVQSGVEILVDRLNAEDIFQYLRERLHKKATFAGTTDTEIDQDRMKKVANRALDLLIDNAKGIWHFTENTEDLLMNAEENVQAIDQKAQTTDARKQLTKKMAVPVYQFTK
ncbi:family 1 glycosylhydrolase [Terrimonas sp. NA20]|uniref:Family 1 glycosylhydrolase n=1 Tax=Terrimonas ginsenosidimutans TaxID=2908004 RepID=A0ABS9KS34_9BACT|nr:family 1 glycosylhydrolase [Terrimonas ginsenosidimutans]MCG2615130.1 family 1 glycosylhydrolase [Terrimonas ginsenosidimutans]